jgi:hypothetical protein
VPQRYQVHAKPSTRIYKAVATREVVAVYGVFIAVQAIGTHELVVDEAVTVMKSVAVPSHVLTFLSLHEAKD